MATADGPPECDKKKFVKDYLSETGHSVLLERYNLPKGLAYTSGDGIFRSDSALGKTYKFFRFSPTFDLKKKSNCWILSETEIAILTAIHQTLSFPAKSGSTVYYIQFFGKAEVDLEEDLPRNDIKAVICKRPCANCGTHSDIQCDHKNDLKNDPRVLNKKTQELADFQALCRHCNDVKRGCKKQMLQTGMRYSATQLGFPMAFTRGDARLLLTDPHWYVGTYWGDCLAFKQCLNSIVS
jgi:hypothetical protein